jgi:hypothetical protein
MSKPKKGDIVQFETIPFTGVTAGIKIFSMIPKLLNNLTWHPTHSAHFIDENTVSSAEPEGMKHMPIDEWRKPNFRFRIYRPLFGTEYIDYAVKELDKNLGEGYNFLQFLSFMFKRFWCEIANLLLPKSMQIDVRKLKNWFPNGDVCSERLAKYLQLLTVHTKLPLRGELIQWNTNIMHSVDLQIIIDKFPNLFETIEEYNFKE